MVLRFNIFRILEDYFYKVIKKKNFNKRIEFCDGCYNDIIIDFGIDFDRYGGVIVDFCVVYI